MPTLDDTIRALQSQFEAIAKIGQAVYSSPSNPYLVEVQAGANKAVWKQLELLLREPPHLMKYPQGKLQEFNAGKPYEKSVFIMTKFPEANSTIDKELRHLIGIVKECVQNQDFHPRVASDNPRYDETVWGNVEVHLLGCSRGIAIIEDRYRSELNPNVAMEWGWMRAMGRQVLYLRESGFSRERADMMGLIADEFDWNEPEKHIPDVISKWLKGS